MWVRQGWWVQLGEYNHSISKRSWNRPCGEASGVPGPARKLLLCLSVWLCHVNQNTTFRTVPKHSKMVCKLNDGMRKHNWNLLIWFLQLVFVKTEEFCQILLPKKKENKGFHCFLFPRIMHCWYSAFCGTSVSCPEWEVGSVIFLSPDTFTKVCLEIKTTELAQSMAWSESGYI